jgi:hypothetical protein
MNITLAAQMRIFANGITADFKVFEEAVGLHSLQGWTMGSDFSEALLCSLQKHNLELCKLVDIITDGASSVIGSKNGAVSFLYKNMYTS